MTIPRFSKVDTIRYFEMPQHSQLATISQVLSSLVGEGKVKVNVIAALSPEIRDYIIHGYGRTHSDNLLMNGIYKTAASSALAGAVVAILGGTWVMAFISGIAVFTIAGYYFNKRNTLLAINRTVASDATFLDGLWMNKVISLTLPDTGGGIRSTGPVHWKPWVETISMDEETISQLRPLSAL